MLNNCSTVVPLDTLTHIYVCVCIYIYIYINPCKLNKVIFTKFQGMSIIFWSICENVLITWIYLFFSYQQTFLSTTQGEYEIMGIAKLYSTNFLSQVGIIVLRISFRNASFLSGFERKPLKTRVLSFHLEIFLFLWFCIS